MKTPRELLFEKHAGAMPALDKIRRKALAEAFAPEKKRNGHTVARICAKLWAEVIAPWKPAWAGIAVAWLFIAGFALGISVESAAPQSSAPLSRELVLAAQRQRAELASLIQNDNTEVAEPARPRPQPRSFLQPAFRVG